MTLSPNSRAVERGGAACDCWAGFRAADPGIFCELASHSPQTNHVRSSLSNLPVKSTGRCEGSRKECGGKAFEKRFYSTWKEKSENEHSGFCWKINL